MTPRNTSTGGVLEAMALHHLTGDQLEPSRGKRAGVDIKTSDTYRTVVNEALRAGLAALEKRAPTRRRFRTRGFDLGPSLVGSLDNVEEVLSRAGWSPMPIWPRSRSSTV